MKIDTGYCQCDPLRSYFIVLAPTVLHSGLTFIFVDILTHLQNKACVLQSTNNTFKALENRNLKSKACFKTSNLHREDSTKGISSQKVKLLGGIYSDVHQPEAR